MRYFTIVNGVGEEYDITTQETFFHDPNGLGFDYDYEFRQVGSRFVVVNRQMSQATISGKVALLGDNPYLIYYNFGQFLSKLPLKLKYVPNKEDKKNEPVKTTYFRDIVVKKLEKSEINQKGYLDCSINFSALGPWYREIVMENGIVNSNNTFIGKHSLIWVDSSEEELDRDSKPAMKWETGDLSELSSRPTLVQLQSANPNNSDRYWNNNVLNDIESGATDTFYFDNDGLLEYFIHKGGRDSDDLRIPFEITEDVAGKTLVFYSPDRHWRVNVYSSYVDDFGVTQYMTNVFVPGYKNTYYHFTLDADVDGHPITYEKVEAVLGFSSVSEMMTLSPGLFKTVDELDGTIKFSDEDSYSNGIYADSVIENPSRLTIYGPAIGGYVEWTHYVNGVEYSNGKINTELSPDEYLVIDNISVPGRIYKKNAISNEETDLYDKSDFTTARFVTLQNGVNYVSANSEYSDLNIKWEARLQYESV